MSCERSGWMGEHYAHAGRPGRVPRRGKTTPSVERQQQERASPFIPQSARIPLSSNPTAACVRPPSFHISRLDKQHCYKPADLRDMGRRFEAAPVVRVLYHRHDSHLTLHVPVCPARNLHHPPSPASRWLQSQGYRNRPVVYLLCNAVNNRFM